MAAPAIKQVSLSQELKDALRVANWENGNTEMSFTVQLEPSVYREWKKVMASFGKWVAKKKTHVMVDGAYEKIKAIVNEGAYEVVKDGFFPTPNAVIDEMFKLAKPRGWVLEPSAGDGAIVKRLLDEGVSPNMLVCVEWDAGRTAQLKALGVNAKNMDFMKFRKEWPDFTFDAIIMNPPFENNADIKHFFEAWEMLRAGGDIVSVMSAGSVNGGQGLRNAFMHFLEDNGATIIALPDGSFKESGTMVNTVIVHIHKEG